MMGQLHFAAILALGTDHVDQRVMRAAHVATGLGGLLLGDSHFVYSLRPIMGKGGLLAKKTGQGKRMLYPSLILIFFPAQICQNSEGIDLHLRNVFKLWWRHESRLWGSGKQVERQG